MARGAVRLAAGGGTGRRSAEIGPLTERDPDPDVRFRAIAVRAARPDAGAKRAAWQAMVVDKTVPFPLVPAVAAAFWRPGQEEPLSGYAERYLDLLPTLGQGGMIPAMVYTSRLFPLFTIDETVARLH